VPLPWSGDHPPYGFSPDGVETWLPQPEGWASLTTEAESADPGSMLSLYRMALLIRRTHPDLGDGAFEWLPSREDVLAFRRGQFVSVTNLGPDPADLPANEHIWLASAPLEGGRLPTDTTVWLRLPS
jgi:alpha-glucosidase